MTEAKPAAHVVFYDGVCRLCDRTVQFLLRVDRHKRLSFAPLQGSTAEQLRTREELPPDMTTMLFAENFGTDRERIATHSTGVLRMLARAGGPWTILSWLRIIPAPLRDVVYRTVARYRYRWFGRFDTCKLPGPELEGRFLE